MGLTTEKFDPCHPKASKKTAPGTTKYCLKP